MVDPRILDDLARHISNAMPSGMRDLKDDLENNVRASLQSTFSRLDLVTREEFEVQTAVLARTRAKVEALEKRVAELEQRVAGRQGTNEPDQG